MKTVGILVAAVALAVAGCRKTETVSAPAWAERVPTAEERLREEVRARLAQHDTNGVLALLSKAIANPELRDGRPAILREMIGLRLAAGDVKGARLQYVEVAASDLALAAQALGVIEDYLLRRRDYAEVVSWSESLLRLPFPPDVKTRSLLAMADAYRMQGNAGALCRHLNRSAAELPADHGLGVAEPVLRALMETRQFAALDQVLDSLDRNLADKPGYAALVAGTRLWSRINQDQLDEAVKLLAGSATLLSDPERAGAMDAILRRARAVPNSALVDSLCSAAMETNAPGSRCFQTAAYHWVLAAEDRQAPQVASDRLAGLVDRQAPVPLLVSLVDQVFYLVMDKGELPTRRAVLAVCENLRARDISAPDKGRLGLLILDGCFMVEDFARAETLLENEMPEMKAEQRELLLPKVKAHAALAAGRKEEAISLFCEFMKRTAADKEDSVVDPFTGANISREYILGFNAARIARLWSELSRTNEAAEAYQESYHYMTNALGKAKPDTPEYNDAQRQLKQIRAALKLPAATDAPAGR